MSARIIFMTSSGHEFVVHALNLSADNALNQIIARMDSQRAFTTETSKGKIVVNTCSIVSASAEDVPQTEQV